MGAALNWLRTQYGYNVLEVEATIATGVASVEALQNDPDALALTFVNFGAFDIFLSLRQNAPANAGIRITANGGSASFNLRDDFTLATRSWYAISPGGVSSVYTLRLRGETKVGE